MDLKTEVLVSGDVASLDQRCDEVHIQQHSNLNVFNTFDIQQMFMLFCPLQIFEKFLS